MEETPNKLAENWRNPDGTLKEGHPPLEGAGRPKGQTLKEYWRERFQQMTDEEKMEFTNKVGNDLIWKMAEGNPKNDLEHSGTINISQVLDELNDNNNKSSTGDNNSDKFGTIEGQTVEDKPLIQDPEQKEKPDNIQPEQSAITLQPTQVVEKYNPEE